MGHPPWGEITKGRARAGKGLAHILKLPIVPGARDLLAGFLKDGDSLLDIGAGDRNLERFLSGRGLNLRYSSCDTDTTFKHDYHDMDSIDSAFDAVAAFEVIEHMDPGSVLVYFKKVVEILERDGVFVVSTPNVCHPVVFWRDCTHITPFRYDELYGLLAEAGFGEIEIYRTGAFSLKQRVTAIYYRPLLRLLRMDFAPGIAAVARRGRGR